MRSGLSALALAGMCFLGGCVSVPRDRGTSAVDDLLTDRGVPSAGWSEPGPSAPARTLSLPEAVRLAFVSGPTIREQYAELGLATADLQDAVKLPDLGLGYSRLSGGGDTQLTRNLSLVFSEVLLRRSRVQLADAGFAMTRDRVAARLLELEAQVSASWFEYVGARQSAELAAASARAARASADYARRLHAAGNLPPRALAQEMASASAADIAAARAEAGVHAARGRFAALLGLSVREEWQVPARLPSLPASDPVPEDLADRAFSARTDLSAARRETDAFALALRSARAWRWLGDLEVGYERESETGGARLAGPTLHLTLPLFHWNRGSVLRAQSMLEAARARRATLELGVRNDLALGLDRLTTARRIAEAYRDHLLPQRESVSARTQEEVNFMLAGAFEALSARREQFAAYQEYLDAVRDYWLSWLELRRVSGGALALGGDTQPVALDAPPAQEPAHDHARHGEGAHP